MPWSGVAALVLASLLWGTTGTTASFLPPDVSPLAIGASTMGVGGVLLFAASARSAIGVLRDRSARRWVLIGALGVFAYPLAFYAGMDLAGVAVSAGSACSSGKVGASHVLEAMGFGSEIASGTIRISLGAETTKDDIAAFIAAWQVIAGSRAIAA